MSDKTREALESLLAACAADGWWLKSGHVQVMDQARAALAAPVVEAAQTEPVAAATASVAGVLGYDTTGNCGMSEHCINCGGPIDPRCHCSAGRSLAARQGE